MLRCHDLPRSQSLIQMVTKRSDTYTTLAESISPMAFMWLVSPIALSDVADPDMW